MESTRIITRESLFALYIPAFVLAFGLGIAAPAIPVFAKSFNVGVGDASYVFVLYQVGSIAAALPTGLLLDRLGRKRVTLAGPLLVVVSSILSAYARSYPELLVYRFIGGCAQQMWLLGRLTIITDSGSAGHRGRQISGIVGLEMTGRLLGPAVGGVLADNLGVQAPFLALAGVTLVAILPCFWLLKETAPHLQAQAHRLLPNPTQRSREPTQTWMYAIAAMASLPVLMFLLTQTFAQLARGTLGSGAVQLFPVYAYGADGGTIGFISSIAGVIGIPIILFNGTLLDRFGRKRTVVPGFFLLGLSLVAMAYIAAAGLSLETFVVSFVVMQAAQNLTSGSMQVMGADLAPPSIRGKFFGIWRLVSEGATALSPLAFAKLAEAQGYGSSFGFLAVSSIACAVVLQLFVPDVTRDGRPPRSSAHYAADRESTAATTAAAAVASGRFVP